MKNVKEKLIQLYNKNSKHSGYQKLASSLEEIIDESKLKMSKAKKGMYLGNEEGILKVIKL